MLTMSRETFSVKMFSDNVCVVCLVHLLLLLVLTKGGAEAQDLSKLQLSVLVVVCDNNICKLTIIVFALFTQLLLCGRLILPSLNT